MVMSVLALAVSLRANFFRIMSRLRTSSADVSSSAKQTLVSLATTGNDNSRKVRHRGFFVFVSARPWAIKTMPRPRAARTHTWGPFGQVAAASGSVSR